MPWLEAAAALPGKTLAVSLVLWFKAGMTRNGTVKMSRGLAERLKVGRKAVARCLRLLESAGLVAVQREPGQCPVVTILRPEE